MNINVPAFALDHFWEEPPPGSWEFWSFRFQPPCKVGDPLYFRFNGTIIAEAVVAKIERPGESECDRTGKYRSGHKVYWAPDSFVDRRLEPSGAERQADQ
jgi:hypothetical protein